MKKSTFENMRRQEEVAKATHKHLAMSQETIAEIGKLGGKIVQIHDEVVLEFEQGTTTENQDRATSLFLNQVAPKFE